MNLSRRSFVRNSALAAAGLPLTTAGFNYCSQGEAAQSFDFSMGNPEGAVRLNFNENTLGPSPRAIEGATQAISESYRYALGGLLRPHIADYLGMEKEWVLMGTGSTEIQRLAPIAHARDGGNVVAAKETWGGLLTVAENMGLTVKRIELNKSESYSYDVESMLAAVDSETRIFLLVNPNNPTGTTLGYSDLKTIADALPQNVLFVIDQAYDDYQDDEKTGVDLLKDGYTNVLATRTFSKAHALAGLRCGYGLAHPDVLREISKFGCGPGSINIAVFGAVLGALSDPEHPVRSREYVRNTRTYYEQQCTQLGVPFMAGPTPFCLIELGESATAVHEALRERNIIVARGSSWHLPNHIRISYGRPEENQAFFSELRSIL